MLWISFPFLYHKRAGTCRLAYLRQLEILLLVLHSLNGTAEYAKRKEKKILSRQGETDRKLDA